MIDPDKSNERLDKEDEIDADMNNLQKREDYKVNAFKTGGSKEGRYYDKPFDEQQYDSFAEAREREKIEDEEGD